MTSAYDFRCERHGPPEEGAVPRPAREVMARVAARHGITCADLIGPSRKRAIAHPRQEAFHLTYELRRKDGERRYSLPTIGFFYGYRDHTTVLYGIRRHKARTTAARGCPAVEEGGRG